MKKYFTGLYGVNPSYETKKQRRENIFNYSFSSSQQSFTINQTLTTTAKLKGLDIIHLDKFTSDQKVSLLEKLRFCSDK